MIEVKAAANAAVAYLKQIFEEANTIQLEEVEISDDEKYWLITLSFDQKDKYGNSYSNRSRKYKTFKIDATTGNVLSMKIRELS